MFKQHKRIWPNDDLAAIAVREAQEGEDPSITATAALLYAIFGLQGRCMQCVTDGIELASTTLARITKKSRITPLLEAFSRIQM
jgi:hypothetical protein